MTFKLVADATVKTILTDHFTRTPAEENAGKAVVYRKEVLLSMRGAEVKVFTQGSDDSEFVEANQNRKLFRVIVMEIPWSERLVSTTDDGTE